MVELSLICTFHISWFIHSSGRHRRAEWARPRSLEGSMRIGRTTPLQRLLLCKWTGGSGAGPWRGKEAVKLDLIGHLILSWPLELEGAHWSIVVVVIIVAHLSQLFKIDLVTENTANTSKALDELVAFGGTIRHKFQGGTEVLVMLSNPLKE
jgi:hypothetical protein